MRAETIKLMTVTTRHFKLLCLLPWLMLSASDTLALTSDRQEPIQIAADTAVIDDAKGTSIYRGNVIIRQGTLLIEADEVEVISHEREVIQMIATSDEGAEKLAHYEQLPDDSEDRVYADARKITYLVQEERLHLSGDATLKQMKDVVTGELVYYDVNQGIMSLKSTEPGGRINMTINPKEKK